MYKFLEVLPSVIAKLGDSARSCTSELCPGRTPHKGDRPGASFVAAKFTSVGQRLCWCAKFGPAGLLQLQAASASWERWPTTCHVHSRSTKWNGDSRGFARHQMLPPRGSCRGVESALSHQAETAHRKASCWRVGCWREGGLLGPRTFLRDASNAHGHSERWSCQRRTREGVTRPKNQLRMRARARAQSELYGKPC